MALLQVSKWALTEDVGEKIPSVEMSSPFVNPEIQTWQSEPEVSQRLMSEEEGEIAMQVRPSVYR